MPSRECFHNIDIEYIYVYARCGYVRASITHFLLAVSMCASWECMGALYECRIFRLFFSSCSLETCGVGAHARTAMCLCIPIFRWISSHSICMCWDVCACVCVCVRVRWIYTSDTSQDNCFYSDRICDQSEIVAADQPKIKFDQNRGINSRTSSSEIKINCEKFSEIGYAQFLNGTSSVGCGSVCASLSNIIFHYHCLRTFSVSRFRRSISLLCVYLALPNVSVHMQCNCFASVEKWIKEYSIRILS